MCWAASITLKGHAEDGLNRLCCLQCLLSAGVSGKADKDVEAIGRQVSMPGQAVRCGHATEAGEVRLHVRNASTMGRHRLGEDRADKLHT